MFFIGSHIFKRIPFLAGMVLVLVVGTARAEDAVTCLQAELPEQKNQTFDAVLRKALVNGPSVIMREWEAAASADDARGARAPMLPSLNANVNTGATLEQRRGPSSDYDRTFTAILYAVSFYQPVYHWGALTSNYKIGQLRQAMAERNIEETRRLLAIDIRRRYFDVILAANNMKLARENVRRVEADRKNLEQSIADGAEAPSRIDGANRALDIARPELAQAENQYAALRLSLAQVAGVEESSLGDLPGEIPVVGDITEALKALSGSVSMPPSAQLQDLYDSINIEKLSYKINKTRQLPKLGFSASVVQQPDNSNLAEKSLLTSWNASLSVNWNVFDGFASQAAKRSSLNRLRALETRRMQSEQQESAERRAEAARLIIQWEQLRNSERDLNRARSGMEIAEQDFVAGVASQRVVDDARNHYANELQKIYSARAAFYITLATFLSNRGQDPVMRATEGAAK